MKEVNAVWNHPEYQRLLKELTEWERDREFCRHTPEHFLDVARLTCLLAGEAGLPVDKEVVYGAALLHDIGRVSQYKEGIPHEEASARIAEKILPDCGYDTSQQREILKLIREHRRLTEEKSLSALFYRADKLSRNCFFCKARERCDWPEEKMNLEICL